MLEDTNSLDGARFMLIAHMYVFSLFHYFHWSSQSPKLIFLNATIFLTAYFMNFDFVLMKIHINNIIKTYCDFIWSLSVCCCCTQDLFITILWIIIPPAFMPRVYSFCLSVHPYVCSFVSGIYDKVFQKVTLKFLKWDLSHETLIRKHSFLDHRYPGGSAFIPWPWPQGPCPRVGL